MHDMRVPGYLKPGTGEVGLSDGITVYLGDMASVPMYSRFVNKSPDEMRSCDESRYEISLG